MDCEDFGMGKGAPQKLSVEHPRHGHVDGEFGLTGGLFKPIDPRKGFADGLVFFHCNLLPTFTRWICRGDIHGARYCGFDKSNPYISQQ
jgi:hypothetical protein